MNYDLGNGIAQVQNRLCREKFLKKRKQTRMGAEAFCIRSNLTHLVHNVTTIILTSLSRYSITESSALSTSFIKIPFLYTLNRYL